MTTIFRMGALAGLVAAPVLSIAADARLPTDPPRTLGEHPAIVVQRLQSAAGYDYASKFYPHPAWLYLRATPSAEADEAAAARPTARRPVDAGHRFDDAME